MDNELQCPECHSICENIRVEEGGLRHGVCPNPHCKLNQDGIGLISEIQGATIAMSFPIRGPRLQKLMDIIEGKASARHEPLPEDVRELDGLTFCGECGCPMFYDGKKHYRHVTDLPQSQLRKLMRVREFSEIVYKWMITLKFECDEHGAQPNPFRRWIWQR